jgi:hypothetical protein
MPCAARPARPSGNAIITNIIRNEASLNRIREYILTNPLRWHLDVENLNATGVDILWDSLFSPTQNTNTPTP